MADTVSQEKLVSQAVPTVSLRKKVSDRSDGRLIRKIDPFLRFFPFIMKGRNESSVYYTQKVDTTALLDYLAEKNKTAPNKITVFHAVLAALVKTVCERPTLNRFIIGRRLYQRDTIDIAFIVKREFNDQSQEEVVRHTFDENDTIDSICARISGEVRKVRTAPETSRGAIHLLEGFLRMPRVLLMGFIKVLEVLDFYGILPASLIQADPMHTTGFVSNLGSIGADAPYHHLYEWGTTSFFAVMGVIHKDAVVMADGTIQARDVMNIGFTLDERIGDGFYFARSIKRMNEMLEDPTQLETPSSVGVKG